jgi:hypothetical protein
MKRAYTAMRGVKSDRLRKAQSRYNVKHRRTGL